MLRAMPAGRAGDFTGCLVVPGRNGDLCSSTLRLKWLGMVVLARRLRFQRPPRYCYANPQGKMAPAEGNAPSWCELTARCIACLPHRNETFDTFLKWSSVRDSHPRHAVCRTAVLAAELTDENGATGGCCPRLATIDSRGIMLLIIGRVKNGPVGGTRTPGISAPNGAP